MQVFHFHRLLSPALHPPKRCRLLSVCYFLLVDSVSHCWRKQTVTFSALSFLVQVECCWHSQRLSLFSFVLFFAQRNFIFVVWDRPWASKALNRQTLHSCAYGNDYFHHDAAGKQRRVAVYSNERTLQHGGKGKKKTFNRRTVHVRTGSENELEKKRPNLNLSIRLFSCLPSCDSSACQI